MPNSEHCLPGYLCTGLYAVNTSGMMPTQVLSFVLESPPSLAQADDHRAKGGIARGETPQVLTVASSRSADRCRKQLIGGPKPGDCRGPGGRSRPLAPAGLGGDACHGARPRRCDRAKRIPAVH